MEMSTEKEGYYDCSFVSIHYIICECGETFPTENGLKAHLEREHPHKREKKEYKCGVCGATFDNEDDCINHYEETHIEIKQEEVEDDIKTEYCEETIVTSEPQNEEVVEDSEVQTYHIPEEYEQIVQVSDGQLVLLVRDPPKQEQKKAKTKPRRLYRNIVCEVCGKKYASNAALKYHQRVHTGERPFKCHLCPKAFTMPLFLQIHIRTHTGERPYQCPLCPKAFSNKAALLRHDRVHTGVKPYACPMCEKSFTQSNSMKLHVTTVHLKQPAPYKSKNRKLKEAERAEMRLLHLSKKESMESNDVHGSSSEDEKNYEIHTRTHTNIGVRAHQCPQCPKAFYNRAALMRHDRVHTGVKPYICPMCFKTFTQSNSMKLHVTTVHLKQPAPYKSKSKKLKEAERAAQNLMNQTEESPPEEEGCQEGEEGFQEGEEGFQEGEEGIQEGEDGFQEAPESNDAPGASSEDEKHYEVILSEEVGGELGAECFEIIYE